MRIWILEIGNEVPKLENWNFKNWELNLEIGILKNLFKDGILKIKFGIWNLEFWKKYLKI